MERDQLVQRNRQSPTSCTSKDIPAYTQTLTVGIQAAKDERPTLRVTLRSCRRIAVVSPPMRTFATPSPGCPVRLPGWAVGAQRRGFDTSPSATIQPAPSKTGHLRYSGGYGKHDKIAFCEQRYFAKSLCRRAPRGGIRARSATQVCRSSEGV
jgi:hypothetical protein